MTTQSPTQRAHTSPSIEEALAALENIDVFARMYAPTKSALLLESAHIEKVRSALTSAAQEDAAWREIEAWCVVPPDEPAPEVNFTYWTDSVTLELIGKGTSFYVRDTPRLAAIVAAGEWCRAGGRAR